MLSTAFTVLHIIACIFLVVVVLLQTGKGTDVNAVFGGSSQTIFGSSGAGNFLTRLTTATAAVFMATSLYLTYGAARQTTKSVFDAETPPPAATTPVTPAIPATPEQPAAAPGSTTGTTSEKPAEAPATSQTPPAAPAPTSTAPPTASPSATTATTTADTPAQGTATTNAAPPTPATEKKAKTSETTPTTSTAP